MDYLFIIFKSMIDPVFIISVLLLIALLGSLIGKKKGAALIIFFTFILLYGASIFPTANYLSYYLEKDYLINRPTSDKNIDVLVVLGNGAYDINGLKKTYPSIETTARLVHAVEIFKIQGAQYFVCSGKGGWKVTEAELMAATAEILGVPREKIRIEAKSNSTWEHAGQLNKIFINKKMHIGLVTSAFHMKRSEEEFKKYFSNILPLPSDYLYASSTSSSVVQFLPQTHSLYKTGIALKEVVARAWYFVRSI